MRQNRLSGAIKHRSRSFMTKRRSPMSRPEYERLMNGGFKLRTGKVA
jgi:hypothetical protein